MAPRKKSHGSEHASQPAPRTSNRPKVPTKRADETVDVESDNGGKAAEKSKKERAAIIPWGENPLWISTAVEYLTNNPEFRLRLFSDSTEEATKEGRKKQQGKESKINLYGTLADAIFQKNKVTQDVWEDYEKGKHRYAKSLQQQFSCLKKEYSAHVQTLYQTGGGLKPEDTQNNLIEKIKESFPHWDALHGFWRELPNYNPIGVTNSVSGGDHAGRAQSLFRKNSSEAGDTSGIDEDLEEIRVSRGRSTSSVGDEGDVDELIDSDEEIAPIKPEKDKEVSTRKSAKPAKTPAKTGDKRAFDLSALDDAHRQDMADSARRQDTRLALEMERTKLQIEREKNKKRKLEFEAERMRMDQQERRERLRREEERDNRLFSLISGMVGGSSQAGHFGVLGNTSSSFDESSTSQLDNQNFFSDGFSNYSYSSKETE
ncbi:hypothetical protein MSAN_00956800 [Mycena sanguinolenta]|uniref:Uncharacterized protein n=1 Tax=Mycena sanguinolenta TaxID=230812 RepID=A0A8H6YZ76_9AGAR|nr:hypothetical protein MSAN_00956800 [Mycena sanguinolenta]